MNMQAMLKQAQKIQKEMMAERQEINEKVFEYENDVVKVKMNGEKKLLELKIKEVDDVEMLEDMMLVAVNQVIQNIEEEIAQRMNKYTQGMPGMH